MKLKRIEHKKDGELQWIETLYNSSNIIRTEYFFNNNRLVVTFSRGNVYSYYNFSKEDYDLFESSESQGKYFHKNIKSNPKYSYDSEYKLYDNELKELNEMIKTEKDKINENE